MPEIKSKKALASINLKRGLVRSESTELNKVAISGIPKTLINKHERYLSYNSLLTKKTSESNV